MNKFVNLLRRQEGVTLIELIASLVLFAAIAGLIYGVVMFGLRSYNSITAENTLRDEGDLLMSAIITEMYTFAPETVSPTADGILLQRGPSGETATEEISIKDGKMQISPSNVQTVKVNTDITSTLAPGSGIVLDCSDVGSCGSGLINIKLNLVKSAEGKDFKLSLESKFGF